MKIKRLIAGMLVFMLALGSSQGAYAEEPGVKEQVFISNSQDMSFKLLRQLRTGGKGENLVFSPLSIQYMLGILNNAADDTTHQGINKLWNYPIKTKASLLNEELQKVKGNQKREYVVFDIANAMFVKQDYAVNADFKKVLDAYGAEIQTLDFTKNTALATVNDWASEHTNGRIPTIIDKFGNAKDMRMLFINAVNLEARWESEFNPKSTAKKSFKGSSKNSKVNMMSSGIEDGFYYENSSLQFVKKRLNGNYMMFVLLPRSEKKDALDMALKNINGAKFEDMLRGSDTAKVKYTGKLYLPRFKVESGVDNLQDSLKAMGLDLNSKTANFNKATVNPKWPLILSKMLHKATFEVDEKGVTASAVTVAEMSTGAMLETRTVKKVEVNVNRPFAYGVVDYSGNILFLGTVENLPEAEA